MNCATEPAQPGPTTAEAARIKGFERKVRELRRANKILKKASAYFAQLTYRMADSAIILVMQVMGEFLSSRHESSAFYRQGRMAGLCTHSAQSKFESRQAY
ncbi:hypothetical protein GOB81_16455 [Acetobacter sp. LMG 1627]|uniref:Transposase n=1 Tax=Acetobacter conturbans TaxID=1737472 RepID=A0ABX0K345_9PROT|nr:hypothetical protein [Acetobacter conturbans]